MTIDFLQKQVQRVAIQAKERVLDIFSGMYHSRFKGKGIEIDDLREYQAGDDIRSIAWTKMAQMGRPFVKNFKEERDLTALLVVDISASEDFKSHYASKREQIAELGAVIALSAIYNHDRVGLILFSSKIEKYIPPKRGVKHGMRLIRELLSFEAKERKTNLKEAFRFLHKVSHKRAIAFFISDFQDGEFEKELLLAAKKHDLICAIVSDKEEESLAPLGLVCLTDPETAETYLVDITKKTVDSLQETQKKRTELLHALITKSRATPLKIATTSSISSLLQAFFVQRKAKRI